MVKSVFCLSVNILGAKMLTDKQNLNSRKIIANQISNNIHNKKNHCCTVKMSDEMLKEYAKRFGIQDLDVLK